MGPHRKSPRSSFWPPSTPKSNPWGMTLAPEWKFHQICFISFICEKTHTVTLGWKLTCILFLASSPSIWYATWPCSKNNNFLPPEHPGDPGIRTNVLFNMFYIFSSPEPKAHWWAISIPVTPASVRPSVRLSSVNILKHLLLWNYWANWTYISYGDSLGWGNESLFKWSWSHDQDGRHAHIW